MFGMLQVGLAIVFTVVAVSSCGGSGGTDTTSQTPQLKWYTTCGDPVCTGYLGPFPSVPLCTTENAGDACAVANAECDPKDGCNARLRCTDKDPRQQAGGCPISRALYKREIRYLSDAQRTILYQQVLALRLATYRYKDAGPNANLRLGFLIDDVKGSSDSTLATLVVDAERDQVDLYSYTSLVVATLQVQARQIEDLQQEVRRLREEIRPRSRSGP